MDLPRAAVSEISGELHSLCRPQFPHVPNDGLDLRVCHITRVCRGAGLFAVGCDPQFFAKRLSSGHRRRNVGLGGPGSFSTDLPRSAGGAVGHQMDKTVTLLIETGFPSTLFLLLSFPSLLSHSGQASITRTPFPYRFVVTS